MPRVVAIHAVKDVKHWVSKGDERVGDLTPFATDVVSYVAADGSNQVAVSANLHDMEGLMAYMQSPGTGETMEAHGVIQPVILHIEVPSPE